MAVNCGFTLTELNWLSVYIHQHCNNMLLSYNLVQYISPYVIAAYCALCVLIVRCLCIGKDTVTQSLITGFKNIYIYLTKIHNMLLENSIPVAVH